MSADVTFAPFHEARAAFGDARIALRMLVPPWPALGVGQLRVLRVRDLAEAGIEVTAGYDTYERVAHPDARG
jgi:hypothetical protein